MPRMAATAAMAFLWCAASALPAGAQGYVLDARRIGMGGAGTHQDDAAQMTCESRRYRYVGLPFGLIQVANNTDVFNPSSSEFNPILAVEYIGNPMAVVFDRGMSPGGTAFVSGIVNDDFNPDLNTYKGFSPVADFAAQGISAPNWGHTFKFRRRAAPEEVPTGPPSTSQYFQGIYVGAGPYFSLGTTMSVDPRLIEIFESPNNIYIPNTTFPIAGNAELQLAGAITAGYRARFKLPYSLTDLTRAPRGGCGRNGIFVAANVNYLQGIHYENGAFTLNLNTNAAGLVTLAPGTSPLIVNRLEGDGGHGYSVDLATSIVAERWSLSLAARGLGNRINWRDLDFQQSQLTSLTTGADFIDGPRMRIPGATRVSLPVRYSALGRYDTERWSTSVDAFYGLNNFELYGGVEYRAGILDFRGGARHSLQRWNPAAGIGINFTEHFALDIAGFGATTNIEETRKAAISASLRFER